MSTFFGDTMEGLLEAMEISRKNLPLKKREGMPEKTYYVADEHKEFIDKSSLGNSSK